MRKVGHCLSLRTLCRGQIALILDYLKRSRRTEFQLPLICLKHLLLKITGLSRSFVAGTCLFDSYKCVLDIDANLTGAALQIQLILTKLQHANGVVGLRSTIAQWNVEGNTG